MRFEAILIIDESGAKGYANDKEKPGDDFGVISGIMVPVDRYEDLKKDVENLVGYPSNQKTHITDLSAGDQKKLRDSVFELMNEYKIPWVYDAAYAEGFRLFENKVNEKFDKKNTSVSWNIPHTPSLLHAKLFRATFVKSAEFFFSQSQGQPIRVKIISDPIDSKTESRFRDELDRYLNAFRDENVTHTGFDRKTKAVVEVSFELRSTLIVDHTNDLSDIEYSLHVEDNALTFLADILVNSVHYHLKQAVKNHCGVPLNSESAIRNHPLFSLAWGYVPEREGAHVDFHDEHYR